MGNIIYIFLDVDGVLNNKDYLIKCYNKNGHRPMHMYHYPFDPDCLNNLMKLNQYLESKNLKPLLILSSTWRLDEEALIILSARLAEYGLKIFDSTEFIKAERGKEIKNYIINHPRYKDFIIIDDEIFDFKEEYLLEKLIRTEFKTGFDNKVLNKALEYFEGRI